MVVKTKIKTKGIIFDLDGTLADTMGDLMASMNKMLSHYGFPHRTRDELLRFINGGAVNFVRSSLPEDKQNDRSLVNEAFEIYNDIYKDNCTGVTYLYDGVYDTVIKLKQSGIKLAVLSNKQDYQTCAIISKLFGDDVFDIVMGHADFPHKPDPTAVFHILDTLSITADETLFIGDSDVDINSAINSGTYPVGVSWGYRSPDILIQTGAAKIIYDPSDIFNLI